MSLNGYDLSDNQGNIDNAIVPNDFVIIKATEGVGYTDPNCDANYQQAKNAGKKLGIYHFARPDGNDPVSEAQWFAGQTVGYRGEAVFALDMETAPANGDWVGWSKSFLDEFFTITGIRPLIYLSASKVNAYDWSSVWPDYGLWVASWGINAPVNGYAVPSTPVLVNGDWTIALWQYTSKGQLPNWSGFLDLDVFYGDVEAWDKYASVYVPPAPEPQQPVVEPIDPTDPTPPIEPVVPVVNPVTAPQPIVTPSIPLTFWQKLWKLLLGFLKEVK